MLKTMNWHKSQQSEMELWNNYGNNRSQFSIEKFWENELHHFYGNLTMEGLRGRTSLK